MSGGISNTERRALLWKLQNQRCAGCGHRIRSRSINALTIDEAIPRARGGRRAFGNQLAMHRLCNLRKADRMPNGCEKIWLEMVNAKLRVKGKVA